MSDVEGLPVVTLEDEATHDCPLCALPLIVESDWPPDVWQQLVNGCKELALIEREQADARRRLLAAKTRKAADSAAWAGQGAKAMGDRLRRSMRVAMGLEAYEASTIDLWARD